MKQKKASRWELLFPFSWRDLGISLMIMGAVSAFSFLMRLLDGNDTYVPMLFVMAVFLVPGIQTAIYLEFSARWQG